MRKEIRPLACIQAYLTIQASLQKLPTPTTKLALKAGDEGQGLGGQDRIKTAIQGTENLNS